MTIKKYLGIADVHLTRILKLVRAEDEFQQMLQHFIEEANEITKARVESLGGNCLLNLKLDINTLEATQSQIYVMISCFGDVVEVEQIEGEIKRESPSSGFLFPAGSSSLD